jgi:hypothetical protein
MTKMKTIIVHFIRALKIDAVHFPGISPPPCDPDICLTASAVIKHKKF